LEKLIHYRPFRLYFIKNFKDTLSLNISQSSDKEKNALDHAISQLRNVYDLLRRDSYYKEEKHRKDEEVIQRIIKQLKQQSELYGSLARG
jgi:hypothetical protein